MKNQFPKIRYIILKDNICYDNDDYEVWGAVLYDIETKKVVTTKYGHGADMGEREYSIDLQGAIGNGIIDEETLKVSLLGGFCLPVIGAIEYCSEKHLNIPCTVSSKCRLIQGDVILLLFFEEYERSRYSASRRELTHKALVFSSELNRLATINPVHLHYKHEVIEEIHQRAIRRAVEDPSLTVSAIAHWYAYNMSYSACDSRHLRALQIKLIRSTFPYAGKPDISTASFPQQERKREKNDKRKAEVIDRLREWARSVHPEYNEKQVNCLAERVWNKNYANL